jgi:taurine dioxygenase
MFKTVTADSLDIEAPEGIQLYHLAPTIGTEVLGIDLSEPLNDSMFGFLHRLLLDRKVIFFRDQKLTPEQHLDFGRRWGQLEIIPFLDHDATYPELLSVRRGSSERGYENVWHSDVSWRAEPSMGSILYAHKVPAVGGDTMWCDMAAAYDSLSASMKEMINGLTAVHSIESMSARLGDKLAPNLEKFPPQEHPVVRTHPETGRKVIYVGAHTRRIKGLSPQESQWLLGQLVRYAEIPEFQCRFRWRDGSMAFWDNRSTQHYAISDYFPQERFLDRVTVRGDRPF